MELEPHHLVGDRGGAGAAVELADAVLAVLAALVLVPERKEKTIREHAETFLATYKPDSKPSEKRTKRWVLEARLLPYFGDMTISQLDQPTVDGFVAAELQGRSVKTVNNRLAVLSTLIKYVTGDKPRLRFKIAGMAGEMSAVAMEDVEKILATAGPRDRAAVLLAAEAGLRAGEIRGLQWATSWRPAHRAPRARQRDERGDSRPSTTRGARCRCRRGLPPRWRRYRGAGCG